MVSAGLTSGLWIHTLLVVLGVGNFLTQYPQSQRVIECLGGMYLLVKKSMRPLDGFVMNHSN